MLYSDSWNNDLSQDWKRYGLPQTMGDPVRDADALKAVSPLQLADKLTRPLLLAMGGRDRRVAVEHGDKLNQALRAAGRAPQYVVYPGEGHGWLMQETRRDFHERLEKFLGEQLR